MSPVPPAGPLPLAGSVYLETADPEHARREMSKILAPHAMAPIPGDSPFRVRHHHARLAGMSVNYIRYSPGALVSADLSRRFFLIHHVLSGRCRIGLPAAERRLEPGGIAVINPTEPFTVRASDDCGQIVIKLEAGLVADIAHRRFAIGRETPVRFDAGNGQTRYETVAETIDFICREADRMSGGEGGPRTERMLAELLAVALIEFLPHGHSAAIRRGTRGNGIAPWYVKRAEEYIELHAEQPLRIADMAAVAGVSERTLYNGFRHWRGLSPKAYLKTVRLDRARTELLGLDAKNRSVGDVALACGFGHLGNFARDYQARFGERPSDTLRFRLPDEG